MPRTKGGPKTRQRRKKRLKLAKGQYGAKSRLFRTATESDERIASAISASSGSHASALRPACMASRIAVS